MTLPFYVVKAAFDDEAEVWFVEHSDVPGLSTEAPSFDELCRKVGVMASELLEANHLALGPVEIIAHASAKLSLDAA